MATLNPEEPSSACFSRPTIRDPTVRGATLRRVAQIARERHGHLAVNRPMHDLLECLKTTDSPLTSLGVEHVYEQLLDVLYVDPVAVAVGPNALPVSDGFRGLSSQRAAEILFG